MKKSDRKVYSIKSMFLIPFLAAVFVQATIFFGSFFASGTMDQLQTDAANMLNDKVTANGSELEKTMINHWSAGLDAAGEYITDELTQQIGDKRITRDIASRIIRLMDTTQATGGFVILNNNALDRCEPIFYVQNPDPNLISDDNGGMLLKYGSSTIGKNLGLTLDASWSTDIVLNPNNAADSFYFDIQNAVKEYPKLKPKDFLRWSESFKINPDDGGEIITCTMPLLNSNHEMIGAAGVEISLEQLMKKLPAAQIAGDNRGSYTVGIAHPDGTYTNVVKSGAMFDFVTRAADVTFRKITNKPIYYIESASSAENVIGSIYQMELYNSNTPFEKERWIVCGMMSETLFNEPMNRLNITLMIAFALAVIVSVTIGVCINGRIAKPFNRLTSALRQSDPDSTLILPEVHITEVDELSNAVEFLSGSVAKAASRMSEVFKVMNLPIGAIEYEDEANQVICTEKVGELLNFSEPNRGRTRFTTAEFKEEMSRLRHRCFVYQESETDEDGVYSSILCESPEDETARYVNFRELTRGAKKLTVVSDVTEQVLEKKAIEHERDYDVLTSLLNRRAFNYKVREVLAAKPKTIGAMVMWDLDNLKYVNDTCGHDFGDKYILEAANVIGHLSESGGTVARMSGDEFFVFIYGYSSKEALLECVRNTQAMLLKTEMRLPNNRTIKVRASAGVAWYPDDAADYDLLIKYADFAMYRAKSMTKGEIHTFNEEEFKRDELLFSGKEELNQLIDNEMVHFAFQPIVDMQSGEVYAYEALMRPQSNSITNVSDLMRLAIAQSKLNQIETLTWQGALRDFSVQLEKSGNAKIFINSIPNIMLSEDVIAEIAEDYKEILNRIVLEFIENDRPTDDCMNVKEEIIKGWNAEIALDDFGTGYNTDSSLLNLEPAFIKIDIEIIRDIDRDKDRQVMLDNVINFTKNKGIKVIAEGVETYAELETVMRIGVDYVQGFYFAYPDFEVKDITIEKKEEVLSLYRKYRAGKQ